MAFAEVVLAPFSNSTSSDRPGSADLSERNGETGDVERAHAGEVSPLASITRPSIADGLIGGSAPSSRLNLPAVGEVP